MVKRNRLLLLLFCVVVLASMMSRFVVWWIGIETTAIRQWSLGETQPRQPLVAMGSSLTFFGLAFDQISEAFAAPVFCRSAASASPCELEQLLPKTVDAQATLIGVSIYDLNEYILSDFRADIVPLSQSVSDLRKSHADWPFTKKILGQYPLYYARAFFPTAGRSVGVMAGLRDKASRLLNTLSGKPPPKVLTMDPNYKTKHPERLADWDDSRVFNNVSLLRVACSGKHEFSGPKHLALKRMLTESRGKVALVVFPVSPKYRQEFIDKKSAADFEKSVEETKKFAPSISVLRLDQLPELNTDKVFWDLAHLNDEGQKIATAALLAQLRDLK